jgi:hypothetical protein
MRRIYSVVLSTLLLVCAVQGGYAASKRGAVSARRTISQKTGSVKVYLVALGDNGKRGKKIGCDDSLVPVTREVKPTVAPLRAALDQLLSMPREYAGDSSLNNFWVGNNLRVKSVAVSGGTATIYIVGEGPFIAGICDEPRVTSQIEATARQFSTVKRVKVFVNGRTLADAIR